VNFIDWANANSGFLLVLLTGVYVCTTLAILLVMAKANRLTSRSIEQTIELEKARIRPFLSLSLKVVRAGRAASEAGVPYGYLVLKNSGITQAYDISIDMEPQIYSMCLIGATRTRKVPYFIEHKFPNLAPGTEISDDIGFLPSLYEELDPPQFRGQIRYRDATGNKYVDSFAMDFAVMATANPYLERDCA
jgi:hypothetical protein